MALLTEGSIWAILSADVPSEILYLPIPTSGVVASRHRPALYRTLRGGINREIANAIFEGARNARGGERQFAAGCGLAESNLHLFEPVQLLL